MVTHYPWHALHRYDENKQFMLLVFLNIHIYILISPKNNHNQIHELQ